MLGPGPRGQPIHQLYPLGEKELPRLVLGQCPLCGRQLPQAGQQALGRALAQGHLFPVEQQEHRAFLHAAGLRLGLYRQLLATPWAKPRQTSRRGHKRHLGAPPGRQTMAPSSIRD